MSDLSTTYPLSFGSGELSEASALKLYRRTDGITGNAVNQSEYMEELVWV